MESPPTSEHPGITEIAGEFSQARWLHSSPAAAEENEQNENAQKLSPPTQVPQKSASSISYLPPMMPSECPSYSRISFEPPMIPMSSECPSHSRGNEGREMEGRCALAEEDKCIDMRSILQKVVTRELCVAIDDIEARFCMHMLRWNQSAPNNNRESRRSMGSQVGSLPKMRPLKSRLAVQELKGREDGERLLRATPRSSVQASERMTKRASRISDNAEISDPIEGWAAVVSNTKPSVFTTAIDLGSSKRNKSSKMSLSSRSSHKIELMTTFSKLELGLPWYSQLIRSAKYDMVVAFIVTTNAVIMGLQANWVAQNNTADIPAFYRGFEIIFCICFVVELAIRFGEYRLTLFTQPCWKWNVLDVLLVSLQVMEEVLALVTTAANLPSLTAVRVLRVLRILRIMRFVRIMRLVGELRILVTAIATSLKALMWTMVLIALVIYIFALTMLQLVSEHRMQVSHTNKDLDDLTEMFGNLMQASKTLFGAFTGGWSWHEIANPLEREVSAWLSLLMVAYIAFMVLALMNVVTGVFVDSAITKTKEQSDIFMINNVREIFEDLNEEMGWEDFEAKLLLPEMQRYFTYLDVDISDARALFHLIDGDNSGSIDAEEFLTSCLQLRGPAKSLDFHILQRDFQEIKHEVQEFHSVFEKTFGIIHTRAQLID